MNTLGSGLCVPSQRRATRLNRSFSTGNVTLFFSISSLMIA
jgi:hypothetical protein